MTKSTFHHFLLQLFLNHSINNICSDSNIFPLVKKLMNAEVKSTERDKVLTHFYWGTVAAATAATLVM